MTFLDTPLRLPQPRLILLLTGVLGSAVMIGMLAGQQPILAVGIVLAVFLALAILAWPDVSTLAVVFILYTNAAVVAVKFHGVPFAIGASVPLLLAVPLVNYLLFRRQQVIITPVLPLLFVFLIIQVLGTLFSQNIRASLETLITFVIEGLGLYFLITNVVRTSEMLRRVVWVLLMAGALMGGLSLYQQITRTYDNNYGGFAQMSDAAFGTGVETLHGEVEQPRLAGPIGEQNRYAQTMLMLVPLALFRFWGERSNLLRALAGLAAGLISLGVVLTFSRSAAIAFLLMLVCMTFLRYIKPYQLALILLGVALLLAAVPQYGTRLILMQDLVGAVADDDGAGIADADGSTRSRLTEMLAATLVFVDHPVVGVGPGMFRYHYREYAEQVGLRVLNANRQAHSLLPGIAAENGALGLTCFLAIVFVTLRNLAHTRTRWRCREPAEGPVLSPAEGPVRSSAEGPVLSSAEGTNSRPEFTNMTTGFMLAIITYLTTGLFLHFAFVRFFWLMMALASAASYVATTEVPAEAKSMGQS